MQCFGLDSFFSIECVYINHCHTLCFKLGPLCCSYIECLLRIAYLLLVVSGYKTKVFNILVRELEIVFQEHFFKGKRQSKKNNVNGAKQL